MKHIKKFNEGITQQQNMKISGNGGNAAVFQKFLVYVGEVIKKAGGQKPIVSDNIYTPNANKGIADTLRQSLQNEFKNLYADVKYKEEIDMMIAAIEQGY